MNKWYLWVILAAFLWAGPDQAANIDSGKALLSEGFESGGIPLNWTVHDLNSDSHIWSAEPATSLDPAHSGQWFASVMGNSLGDRNDWLVTPPLLPQVGDSLNFWALRVGQLWGLSIKLSTTGSNPEDFTDSLGTTNFFLPRVWTEFHFDLSPYAGDTVYVAFIYDYPSYSSMIMLDDISGPEVYIPPFPVFNPYSENVQMNEPSGLVAAGDTAKNSLYFDNQGAPNLNVQSWESSAPEISVINSQISVPSLTRDSLQIEWAPSGAGTQTGWIALHHNGPSSPDTIHLSIQAAQPEAYVINFEAPEEAWDKPYGYGLSGIRKINASRNAHWGKQSIGLSTSAVYSPRLEITPDGNKLGFYCNTRLNEQNSDAFDSLLFDISVDGGITWSPVAAITGYNNRWEYYEYDLSAYNGQDNVVIRWAQHAVGGGNPAINGDLDDLVLPKRYDGPMLFTSRDFINFDAQLLGTTASRPLDLFNSGTLLTIYNVTSDNPRFTPVNVPAQIGQFSADTIDIEFSPLASGWEYGNITIAHDGVTGARENLVVPVAGFGLAPHDLNYIDDFENKGSLLNYVIDTAEGGAVTVSKGWEVNGPFSGDSTLGFIPSDAWRENAVTLYLNLQNYTNVDLSFAWAASFHDSSQYITCDIYDGQWHLGIDSLVGVDSSNIGDAAGNNLKTDWVPKQLDLGNYNMINRFAIRFRANGYAFLDQLKVENILPDDYAVKSFVDLPVVVGRNVASPIIAVVKNVGLNSQTDIPVKLFENGVQNGDTRFVSLAPNEADSVVFSYTGAASGVQTLTVQSFLPGDGNPANDTISAAVDVHPIQALPFQDDLEDSSSLGNYFLNGGGQMALSAGDSTVMPISGDSMLKITPDPGEARTVEIFLLLDLSAAINPEISLALGCANLAYFTESAELSVWDGEWHNYVVELGETQPVTQHVLNVNENGWNKTAGFAVRLTSHFSSVSNDAAVFLDNVLVFDVVPGDQKILLSEIVTRPLGAQYIEIFNPNDVPVSLGNYYLTDASYPNLDQYYYNIVTGAQAGGGRFGDFHARFPDGAVIMPGEYQTVALAGDSAFFAAYGILPTYELYEDGSAQPGDVPDMREALAGAINQQGDLEVDHEMLALYFWDGASDLVQDVDYLIYDNSGNVPDEAVDKSGIRRDGPDPDTMATAYLNDTPLTDQYPAAAPAAGFSLHRKDMSEGNQAAVGGNGISGADETSEDLQNTFTTYSIASPNAGWQWPTYAISGTILLGGSVAGLQGTVVAALRDGAVVSADTTNPDGAYQLAGLDSGSYVIQAKRFGFIPQDSSLYLSRDVTLDLTLVPSLAVNSISESFEDDFPPVGWLGDFGTAPAWHRKNGGNSGSYSVAAGYQAGSYVLISPKINLSQSGVKRLSFAWKEFHAPADNTDSTFVEITTDGLQWTVLKLVKAQVGSQNWMSEDIDLSAYGLEEQIWIRWRYESDGGYNTYPFQMDDVGVGDVVGIGNGSDGLPKTFDLAQNYPNPFNPLTHIKFQLPRQEKIKIEIYNISGQRVRTLVNREYAAGRYQIEWNGMNDAGAPVATGMYVCRLAAGDFRKSIKMIFLK